MSKILPKIFPFLDYLYIYQQFEYHSADFLNWFIKNPFKRNLQKKHHLVWTSKVKILVSVSLLLIFLAAWSLTSNLLMTLVALPFIMLFSPIFLILSRVLIYPLEFYQKQQILNAAKQKLAKLNHLKVIAITGSFGKTSTKDILYTLLWKKYYVVKTPKSFNTPLGVAQTILQDLKDNTQIFIAEVGAYKKGEIKKIAELIHPQIGIITAIAPQHLERFGSLENIAQAKFELPHSLPQDGVAILNSSYPLIKQNANSLNSKVLFYGHQDNPFYATNIKLEITGTVFTMHTPKGKIDLEIPLIGEHHVYNFLAASIAALQLGLTLSEIKNRAKLLLPTPHRMEIKKLGNLTLIDNSFNTNPKSAESSLKLLASFKESRKIVITPGLVELGTSSSQENEQLGKNIGAVADEVLIVGNHAKKDLLTGLNKVNYPKKNIHLIPTTQQALILAHKFSPEKPTVALIENDLPDQYN